MIHIERYHLPLFIQKELLLGHTVFDLSIDRLLHQGWGLLFVDGLLWAEEGSVLGVDVRVDSASNYWLWSAIAILRGLRLADWFKILKVHFVVFLQDEVGEAAHAP